MNRSRMPALLISLGLTAALGTAAVPAQAATTPCTITNFSPRSTVVGLTPHTTTFGISTTGCTRSDWSLEGDDFFVFQDSPQNTFDPYDNSEAGAQDVIATAADDDYNERDRVFDEGFSLLRRTTWQSGSFNASPEPVKKGGSLTVTGRLLVADWTNDAYVGYAGRTIAIQFRLPDDPWPTGSPYASTVKNVVTAKDGTFRTTVPARTTGVWRAAYGGNTVAGSSVAVGDSVKVS